MNSSTESHQPDYYNSGSVEASTDTALVITRLEAVSFSLIVLNTRLDELIFIISIMLFF